MPNPTTDLRMVGREECRISMMKMLERYGCYRVAQYLNQMDIDFWLVEDGNAVTQPGYPIPEETNNG